MSTADSGSCGVSGSKDERYTPEFLIERVRLTLGGIDLDPMSCEEANKVVKASAFFTKEENGLSKRWQARTVYLNPPGSLRLEAHKHFDNAFYASDFEAGCVCLYDWDHSTEWWKVVDRMRPVYALLNKRAKFSGKDVGRSQAFAFVGVDWYRVYDLWSDIATVLYDPHTALRQSLFQHPHL